MQGGSRWVCVSEMTGWRRAFRPCIGFQNNQLKENEAMSCIQKGNINEAEKIYLELIERETQSHIVYGNLAAIYQMKGNKEKEQIISDFKTDRSTEIAVEVLLNHF